MRIQHNIMAMNAYRNYTNNVSAMQKNLEKLSSGYKINRAGDDAAGLAISEKMRAQISGLEAAQKNAKDGISLVQTAEGALTEVHDMLNRMVTLATQSANGTYDNEVDRAQMQKELDQLRSEIDRIADSSNFNGIKLLDGSMSDNAMAKTIEIEGINSIKSAATKGVYKSVNQDNGFPHLITDGGNGIAMGNDDELTYSVSLSNGKSYSVKFKLEIGEGANFIAEDGTKYDVGPGTSGAIDSAIASELRKTDLGDFFDITTQAPAEDANGASNGIYTFEAMEAGTDTPRITAFDAVWTSGGKEYAPTALADQQKMAINVAATAPTGAGREIAATSITEYDGTNYDKAVFTINGKKFVLMTENMTGADADNDRYMRAVAALGKDVTVLVGGQGGLTNDTADTDVGHANAANFAQNIKKIAEATGLTVTDAIDEATENDVHPGQGIHLSIGNGTTDNSLTLQIGDTADSFNQLKVSINDMHTKAMGIDDISIADQESAQEAIKAIKDAINYVSDVRGTLGATQNRLDHTINNLSVMTENIQDAESTIRDVDVAEEMMAYTKNNILIQSAQAMLAQANQVPQGVLQLLG